ncbi:NACHT domain-containing protein [Achromobacter insolitus]|uniref:NACHT domain-containing protein n=1 Tax=Achromobacter insolitus TaxID=217204 RepID=UPI001EEEB71B|nr:hypothetical protein [Achromobacter insolitus]
MGITKEDCYRRGVAAAILLGLLGVHPARALETSPISCLVPVVDTRGKSTPGTTQPDSVFRVTGGTLLQTSKGWVSAWVKDGRIITSESHDADILRLWGAVYRLAGDAVLELQEQQLSMVRIVDDRVVQHIVDTTSIGDVVGMSEFADGVLIQGRNGWFYGRMLDGKLVFKRVRENDIGAWLTMHPVPGKGLLLQTRQGWFVARMEADKVSIEQFGLGIAEFVNATSELPGVGVLIAASNGVFLAREIKGEWGIKRMSEMVATGTLLVHSLAGPATVVAIRNDRREYLLVNVLNDEVSIEPFGQADMGTVLATEKLGDGSVLVGAEKGWFLAKMADGKLSFSRIETPLRFPSYMFALSNERVLIQSENRWFQAKIAQGKATIEPIGTINTGAAYSVSSLEGEQALLSASNGWFHVRLVDGKPSIDPAGEGFLGLPGNNGWRDEGVGAIIPTIAGWFQPVHSPLENAVTDLKNFTQGMEPRAELRTFIFSVEHECAPALVRHLTIKVTRPDGQLTAPNIQIKEAAPALSVWATLPVDEVGTWHFQFASMQGDMEQTIGEKKKVVVASPSWKDRLVIWSWWLGGGAGSILVLLNAALFIAARRSAWAWRLATDDALGTAALRIATILLSHVRWAQLWILELYFQKRKAELKPLQPFFALPLTDSDGLRQSSDVVTAPPWNGQRLWIQGNSGMGKTALFNYVTTAPFQDTSSFGAFAKWGCIVVAFPARDFADGSEDSPDSGWVIKAVKGALSPSGLTFKDDKLLRRFFDSGVLAVAIDGLHEADRTQSVEAFVREFSPVPMLVTSQESGGQQFSNWRLPADMREFILDLLQLHMDKESADAVMGRINTSGLKDAIRSGYDVRLLIDMAHKDPRGASLPSNRVELYAAVVDKAWSDVPVTLMQEEQILVAATAWEMVSRRKPHEDIRRMKPAAERQNELKEVLEKLADAPALQKKPIRLVRRVGEAFEFVHDQMHAYMAARYFVSDDGGVQGLEKLLAESQIWTHALPTRHALWSFAAALLDDKRLLQLWKAIDDKEAWDSLRRELKGEAERRGLA